MWKMNCTEHNLIRMLNIYIKTLPVQEVDDARKYPAPHVVQVVSVLLDQSNQLITVHDLANKNITDTYTQEWTY